jgi:hypothetical protein
MFFIDGGHGKVALMGMHTLVIIVTDPCMSKLATLERKLSKSKISHLYNTTRTFWAIMYCFQTAVSP